MIVASRISKTERVALLLHTQQVHEDIDKLISSLDPTQWITRRSANEWSPEEIVEHVLLVEDGVMDGVQRHLRDQPSDSWQKQTAGKEAMLSLYLPSGGKVQANKRTSTFVGLASTSVKLALAARLHSLENLLEDNTDSPLKALVWDHSIFGPLNAYHRLLYIPLHSERHLNQLCRFTSGSNEVIACSRLDWV